MSKYNNKKKYGKCGIEKNMKLNLLNSCFMKRARESCAFIIIFYFSRGHYATKAELFLHLNRSSAKRPPKHAGHACKYAVRTQQLKQKQKMK